MVRAIASGGSVTIVTNGNPRENTKVGWAELVTSGKIVGQGIFKSLGTPDQFAAVSLTSGASRLVMPFDNSGAITGIAMINTNKTTPVQIAVTIRDERGVTILTDVLVIPTTGHVFFDLPTKWGLTKERRGILDFKVPGADITGLGFRFVGAAFASTPMSVVP